MLFYALAWLYSIGLPQKETATDIPLCLSYHDIISKNLRLMQWTNEADASVLPITVSADWARAMKGFRGSII